MSQATANFQSIKDFLNHRIVEYNAQQDVMNRAFMMMPSVSNYHTTKFILSSCDKFTLHGDYVLVAPDSYAFHLLSLLGYFNYSKDNFFININDWSTGDLTLIGYDYTTCQASPKSDFCCNIDVSMLLISWCKDSCPYIKFYIDGKDKFVNGRKTPCGIMYDMCLMTLDNYTQINLFIKQRLDELNRADVQSLIDYSIFLKNKVNINWESERYGFEITVNAENTNVKARGNV